MIRKDNYTRILLKLSGEILGVSQSKNIDPKALSSHVHEIIQACQKGRKIVIVVGGGNLWRGERAKELNFRRHISDSVGMLATLMNGLALQEAIVSEGLSATLMSQLPLPTLCETYNPHHAEAALDRGEIVIIGGGIGKPFVTTDTAAVLAALELGCEVMLKGTKVDGVYDAEALQDSDKKPYKNISLAKACEANLGFMDTAALALCRAYQLPVIVYNATCLGNLKQVLAGKSIGTLVHP